MIQIAVVFIWICSIQLLLFTKQSSIEPIPVHDEEKSSNDDAQIRQEPTKEHEKIDEKQKTKDLNGKKSEKRQHSKKSKHQQRNYEKDEVQIDLDHIPAHLTGASKNCGTHMTSKSSTHPHQRDVTISCHTISYRMPPVESTEDIVIGVLSGAAGDGPERRKSIRNTWANGHSVFFIVAGPWEEIQKEYDTNQDMIWINQEESYDSVLTFKTMAFVKIIYHLASLSNGNIDFKYAFKTDDDSYVNVMHLYQYMLEKDHDEYNYWGWCKKKEFRPLRGDNDKWAVSFELYPEPMYPRYCQGAGFALSWKFIECASGEGDHISNARFMPFEDVAMGLIAQRCNIVPTMAEDERLLHMYRTDTSEERNRVNQGKKRIDASKLPIPDMSGRIVQHRIHGAWDMLEHHRSIFEPSYRDNTEVDWYNYDEE